MERFTISLENKLARQFDEYIREHSYSNRSEAIRDLIRARLQAEQLGQEENGHCVATLSYIYNHNESELAARITSAQHDHHDLTLSSMHVHMDHDNCMEVIFLSGTIHNVKTFADLVMASRGVRHGKLHMVPVEVSHEKHSTTSVPHTHSNPIT